MPKVVFLEERCKACELCVTVCPKGIIHMSDRRNKKGYSPATVADEDMAKCTGCTLCARICPDTAIEVYREESGKKEG